VFVCGVITVQMVSLSTPLFFGWTIPLRSKKIAKSIVFKGFTSTKSLKAPSVDVALIDSFFLGHAPLVSPPPPHCIASFFLHMLPIFSLTYLQAAGDSFLLLSRLYDILQGFLGFLLKGTGSPYGVGVLVTCTP
jgi:hypothetical protein